MSLKNSFSSIVFVILLVQQIVSYCFLEVDLFSIYWLAVFGIALFVGQRMPMLSKKYKKEQNYLLIFVVGSFMTFFNGHSIASCIVKAFFILYAYIAYLYVVRNRINTSVFGILLIALYVFFSSAYFFKLGYYGHGGFFDGELFGHSSSNTIPISLNTVLIFYLIIHEYNCEKKYFILFVFSIINVVLIFIQQSRAGIIVSLSLLLIIFYLWKKSLGNTKDFKISFIIIFIGLLFGWWYLMKDSLHIEELGFESSLNQTYLSDIRYYAQISFFSSLDVKSFFLGYPPSSSFEGMTRTYNSFLDIWSKYGIIPFIYLIVLLIKRIVKYKEYNISPIIIIPVLLYSTVESIYAGALWDVVWFLLIYLSYGNNKYSKKNSSYPTDY